MPADASPRSANRAGAVASVNAAGSQSATSSHSRGIDTRASGVGRAPFHLTRESQRRASRLIETPSPLDTHVDVHTARARGLGPAVQPVLFENVAHEQRHPPHKVPAHARSGVEIDAQLVRVLEV